MNREWTKEEISLIRKEGGKKSTVQIARSLNRTTSSIRSKANRIGKSLKHVTTKRSRAS